MTGSEQLNTANQQESWHASALLIVILSVNSPYALFSRGIVSVPAVTNLRNCRASCSVCACSIVNLPLILPVISTFGETYESDLHKSLVLAPSREACDCDLPIR